MFCYDIPIAGLLPTVVCRPVQNRWIDLSLTAFVYACPVCCNSDATDLHAPNGLGLP